MVSVDESGVAGCYGAVVVVVAGYGGAVGLLLRSMQFICYDNHVISINVCRFIGSLAIVVVRFVDSGSW